MSDWRGAAVVVLALLLVVPVWALARLCARSGRPAWLGLLALCPPFGLVLLWTLAFTSWGPPRRGRRGELLALLVPSLLLVATWFLWLQHVWIYEPGVPTPLAAGQTPVEALCAIRAEFEALPKPALDKMTRYEAWTEHKFAAGTFHWRGFWRPELRPEARRFVARHSHLEITAAVSPLILDPELGGEVAVLLAGLPMPRKSSGPGRIGGLASLIADAGYEGPVHRGQWSGEQARRAQRTLSSLHGIEFTLSYSGETRGLQRRGTLDGEIARALEIFVLRVGEPDTVVVDDGRFDDRELPLEEWLRREPPAATEELREELDEFSEDFLTLVAFPLAGTALSHTSYSQRFIWMMNLQGDHWPLLGDRLERRERERRAAELLEAAAAKARRVCDPRR